MVGETDTDVQLPIALDGVKNVAVSVNNGNITTAGGNDLVNFLDGMSEAEVGAVMAERTRRLAEQGSMLAARKLCLVLDLDHTLLNSAKVPGRSPDSIAVVSILFNDENGSVWRRTRVSYSQLQSQRSIEWSTPELAVITSRLFSRSGLELGLVQFMDVSKELHAKLHSIQAVEDSRRSTGHGGTSQQELYCLPHIGMWTKLRPGVRNFLRRVIAANANTSLHMQQAHLKCLRNFHL